MTIEQRIIRRLSRLGSRLAIDILNVYYKRIFKHVGKGTLFLGRIHFYNPTYIEIGDNCSINKGVFFNISDKLIIGNNVTLSANIFITTVSLDLSEFPTRKHTNAPIIIEDDAWIGAGSTILSGSTIGRGSIIGAGAVVTKNVSPHCFYAGVPAKLIREL